MGHEVQQQPDWESLLDQQMQHYRGFLVLAQRLVGSASAAEDICQQALLKTWQQRDKVRDPQRLRGFIAQVVVRESLQVLRKRKLHRRFVITAEQPPADSKMSTPHRVALRQSLLLALDRLEPKTRTVVVLRLVQGLAGNQVAQMLDCSVAQISRRLQQGMEQMRQVLHEWNPGRSTLASQEAQRDV